MRALPPLRKESLILALTSQNHAGVLIRRLENIVSLSDDEKAAFESLPMQVMDIRTDQDVVREGDRPTRSCLLVEGFACMYKMSEKGKRQIMAFYVAGDIPDLQSLHLTVMDASLSTITPCKMGFIQHEALRAMCDQYPRIARALWRETLIDAAIFREWVMNVGRREAYARMAHVLCELVTRSRAVGLAQDDTYEIPMTQNEFADALGISTVHVNRTLQEMRADGLILLKGSKLTIPDWDKLTEAGEFDPTYLHLEQKVAA
jgi:CRP-like cAMP-binding protein